MPLFVAKPSLPKPSDFKHEIKKIYRTHKLTTNGPQVNLLEKKLKKFLGVKNLLLVSNGTMAIQIALETLNIIRKVNCNIIINVYLFLDYIFNLKNRIPIIIHIKLNNLEMNNNII